MLKLKSQVFLRPQIKPLNPTTTMILRYHYPQLVIWVKVCSTICSLVLVVMKIHFRLARMVQEALIIQVANLEILVILRHLK